YLVAVATLRKLLLGFDPTPLSTAIIATAMLDAMMPYSIAVAPDSSAQKLRSLPRMIASTAKRRDQGNVGWTGLGDSDVALIDAVDARTASTLTSFLCGQPFRSD